MAELARAPGERRDELDPGRTAADDADALAVERDRIVPARAVRDGAGEAAQPLDLGHPRMVEHTSGGDDDIGLDGHSGLGRYGPHPIVIGAAIDLLPEMRDLAQAETVGHILEIVLDLGTRRQIAAPFGIRREAVGIGVRGNVAVEPRIAVFAPGAADRVRLFKKRDVAIARLAQPDRRQYPRHAPADDDISQVQIALHYPLQFSDCSCPIPYGRCRAPTSLKWTRSGSTSGPSDSGPASSISARGRMMIGT